MKRHHNTLYVTTQGAYLSAEGETVLVRVERETRLRLPVHVLEGIVCFGRVSCSPAVMDLCTRRGVGIAFLSQRGRFIGRIHGPVSGNVLLRRQQYRRADDARFTADLARAFVIAKITNCRTVLLRGLRDHPDLLGRSKIEQAVLRLGMILRQLPEAAEAEVVRGVEGEAASIYFDVFDHLIVAQKDGFVFRGRSRRPPTDRVNALLSFVYTLSTHDTYSAIETVGLDPQVGFLHRDRPGRPGLALDILEEFRSFIADRLVLSLINRKQVYPAGFSLGETGGVAMDADTRKAVLISYQNRKQEEMKHPFLGDNTTVGMLVHLQASLLARHLRGDLDGYPPFIWR